MIDLSKYIIHDLSLTYDKSIAGYSEEAAKTFKLDGWNAKWLKIYSHAGTHMDAPVHFEASEKTIDEFTPGESMGRAWIVDIDIIQDRQLMEVAHLKGIESKFERGDSLILKTKWSNYVGQEKYRDALPRVSEDLAHWCCKKKVKMLAVEAPSVADVNNLDEVTRIHKILFKGDVIILEGLKNVDKINSDFVFLMAFPIKTRRGDGAPARVIALEEKTLS